MKTHPLPAEANLTVEKLVYGGDGLSRLDGQVVFTPFVLPGERVRAEVNRVKNDLLRGKLLGVTEPSAARVAAPCPYFQRCGGCQYQHASYEYQAAQKREILGEALRRVGKLDFGGEIEIVAGEPWAYRNRAQLHIEGGQIGYFEAGSRQLCPIDRCPISSPKLNGAIGRLARELPDLRWFAAGVELFTNETELQVNVLDRVPASVLPAFRALGTAEPIEYAGFRVSRNSFFQVNRFLVDALADAAASGAAGETAVDLYAGVGLFTAQLARSFGAVTAVESGASAFGDLEFNAQRAGWGIAAEHKSAEEFLATLERAPDLIVADPPRAGLGSQVVAELLRLRSPRLTLVSCDPATLARDLRALSGAGYRIAKLTLLDMFPQTFHMETVARLELT